MVEIQGTIASGRQIASKVFPDHPQELLRAAGYEVYPGTLNIHLRRPVRLAPMIPWQGPDDGRERFLVPATLNGHRVHVNRWTGCPLERVDLIAPIRLRDALGLNDGDEVTLHVDRSSVQAMSLAKWVLWLGRHPRPHELSVPSQVARNVVRSATAVIRATPGLRGAARRL